MENLKEKKSLTQDQQWVESIVKKEHLNRFNLTNTDAPFNYFESLSPSFFDSSSWFV